MISRRLIAAVLFLGVTASGVAAGVYPSGEPEQALPHPTLPRATRGPVGLAFTPDGARVLITEGDTGTLAVLSRDGAVMRRISTGGEQPGGLAVSPAGLAVVSNRFSGSVVLVDPANGARRAFRRLLGEPWDVCLSRDGRRVYVSLAQLNEVAVLRVPSLDVVARVKVGRRPRAMALTRDGRTLVVANFQGGDVSVLDTATLKERHRVALTGVNLRGVALTEDGARAYISGQIPSNSRVTAETLDVWTNTVFTFDLRTGGSGNAPGEGAEGWLDFALRASPDPDGIVALGSDRVAVVLSGSDQVVRVRTPGPYLTTYDPIVEQRTAVGAHPRSIVRSPDGRQLWITNQLDSSIAVLDTETLKPLRRISLGVPAAPDRRLPGRYLFGNAGMTRGRQFTCNSCHPEGGADGLTWEFAHVDDGMIRRNTRNLRGGITLTGPFRWSGRNSDIEEFFQEEVTGLLHGQEQPHEKLHALWNLVDQFPMPPNPFRTEAGELTPAAQRGKRLFEGRAGCASCHGGELRGGTGKKAWVGTTREDQPLDVPHLHGAYDSGPYLHDGRAASLEAIFRSCDPGRKHGKAHQLSAGELADLLRYVREL